MQETTRETKGVEKIYIMGEIREPDIQAKK